MSQPILLDASAVIAYLQGEPGSEEIEAHLVSGATCLVTAANQAEIIAKSLDRGASDEDLREILRALAYGVIDHPGSDGEDAGWLRPATRALGLSLGDRLCLAAARRLGAVVVTADRPWLKLATALGLDIRCIRPDNH